MLKASRPGYQISISSNGLEERFRIGSKVSLWEDLSLNVQNYLDGKGSNGVDPYEVISNVILPSSGARLVTMIQKRILFQGTALIKK